MIYTFDIETDGYLEDTTQCWVLVYKPLGETSHVLKMPTKSDIELLFQPEDIFVGHNIIDFDLPALEKLYGVYFDIQVLDTMVLSYLLDPDREVGHSLDALSGGQKTEYNDFSRFTDEMVSYCINDVVQNERILEKLLHSIGARTADTTSDIGAATARCAFQYRTSHKERARARV